MFSGGFFVVVNSIIINKESLSTYVKICPVIRSVDIDFVDK